MKLMLLIYKVARLILQYAADFAKANFALAALVLSPRMRLQPKTIVINTQAQNPIEILALSNLITFTPGTLTLDVEPGQRLQVHVLIDSDTACELIRQRLEQPLLEITRAWA